METVVEQPINNPKRKTVKYTGMQRELLHDKIVDFRDVHKMTFVKIGELLDITPSLARTIYLEKPVQLSIIDRIKLWFNFGISS